MLGPHLAGGGDDCDRNSVHARALPHGCFPPRVEQIDVRAMLFVLRPPSLVCESNTAGHSVGHENAHLEPARLVRHQSVVAVPEMAVGRVRGM